MIEDRLYATGKRKESVAKVWIRPGKGEKTINGQSPMNYFGRETLVSMIEDPFKVTDTQGSYDVIASVRGGGVTGQAGAVRLGIARALVRANEEFKRALRAGGLLTRDPRVKERRKYGLAKARKRYQFSKR